MNFKKKQEELRKDGLPTIPFVDMPNWNAGVERLQLLRTEGLESNMNFGLNGVTVLIQNEEQFKKMQEVLTEKGLDIQMPQHHVNPRH